MIEADIIGAPERWTERHEAAKQPPAAERGVPGHVGHYQLRRLLGRGGMGTVWEAWDTRLRREVAIKALGGADLHALPAGLREARLTARMRHPAFVALHDVLVNDGLTYLVMELVQGHTLAEIGAAGAVEEARLRGWMRQVAGALLEAHRQGVAHGDIKPSNLMLEGSGRVRVLDLGIASLRDPAATLGEAGQPPAGGTLAYMAPERLLGAPPDAASDSYALGLTMHELLAGCTAGGSIDGLALAHRRLSEDTALPRGPLPESPLLKLLDAMTRRDPAQRLCDMAQVIQALENSAPAPAPATAAPTRAPRVVIAALLLVAALGASGWIAHTNQGGGTARALQSAEQALRTPDNAAGIAAAVTTFEAALTRDPDQARAAAALAIAYCLRNAGNERDRAWLARAAASAQLALRLDDSLALAHAAQAWVLELRGELEPARAAYERALAIDPTEFHALGGLAQLLMRERQDVQALALLERALKAWPDEATFLGAQGAIHFRRGDLAQAEAAFRRTTLLRPTSAVAWANLGAVLTREGRHEEALAVLRQGLAVRPDARLYANLGTSLFALGRYVDAAEALEQAVSADKGSPNDYRNWANLADALRMVPGRQQDAHQAGLRALDLLRPELAARPDATALSRAGLYAARLGRSTEAAGWMKAALAQAPHDPDALLRATLAAEVSGDRATALARAAAALAAGLPARLIDEEPELQALRRDRRYHELASTPGRTT